MSLDVYLYINCDTGGERPERIELFTANITHNLTSMAEAAGIYKALWRPEEINKKHAGDIIYQLENGLKILNANPDFYKKLDSPNRWGTYENFTIFIEEYLAACKKHPKALIKVSR